MISFYFLVGRRHVSAPIYFDDVASDWKACVFSRQVQKLCVLHR